MIVWMIACSSGVLSTGIYRLINLFPVLRFLRIPLQASVENLQIKVAAFNICTKEAVTSYPDQKLF